MSRVFLTGATGFLGSHIADALVAEGHETVISVRSTSNTRWTKGLAVEKVELELGRVGGGGGWEKAVEGCDAVIHCGGATRAPSPDAFLAVNAEGTKKLAVAAAAAGVPRFVFISSLAARGPDGAGGPVSPYGVSKAVAEAWLAKEGGRLDVVVLRPGGIYGPRDEDLLSLFRVAQRGWAVVPRSQQLLQPVYVGDVVTAVLAGLTKGAGAGGVPVLGREQITWEDLARLLLVVTSGSGRVVRVPPSLVVGLGAVAELAARIIRRPPPIERRRARDLATHQWTSELASSGEALGGWEPRVTVKQGLARTTAWYREAGWL